MKYLQLICLVLCFLITAGLSGCGGGGGDGISSGFTNGSSGQGFFPNGVPYDKNNPWWAFPRYPGFDEDGDGNADNIDADYVYVQVGYVDLNLDGEPDELWIIEHINNNFSGNIAYTGWKVDLYDLGGEQVAYYTGSHWTKEYNTQICVPWLRNATVADPSIPWIVHTQLYRLVPNPVWDVPACQ